MITSGIYSDVDLMVGQKLSKSDIIEYDTRVGNIDAENDDDFLFQCFVDNRALSIALDVKSPGSLISGRTGSGKTALLKYIEKNKKNSRISPSEMAMEYISNSDIFRFLNDIGADLDILFQTIWKHILCLEYIRIRHSIVDVGKSKNWFGSLLTWFKGDSEKRAVSYLSEWESKFWISIDENVREIVGKLENQISAEIAIDIDRVKTRAGYGRNMSLEQKSEIIARARKIIDGSQLRDLSKVLDLLKKEEQNSKWVEPCYLLIDNLDDRWIDESIKYKMINALIEAMKPFRKIENLKIVVAIRSDVIERAIQENDSAGFQREKYKDFIVEIKWDEAQLKKLINSRINYLYRRKYTNGNVNFDDVFNTTVQGVDAFQYLIQRTLLRPRDVISFVNICLKCAESKTTVSSADVKKAEREYSSDRRQALLDEWRPAFPTLDYLLRMFSDGEEVKSYSQISVREILEEIALPICSEGKIGRDPLFELASNLFPSKGSPSNSDLQTFARTIISVLYRVGAVGIKNRDTPYNYYYISGHLYSSDEINPNSKLRLVKMLHRAYGIEARHS